MASNNIISKKLLGFIDFFNPQNPNNLLEHYTPQEELNLKHLRDGGKVHIKHTRCGNILHVPYQRPYVDWYNDVPNEFKICCRACANDKRRISCLKKYGVDSIAKTEQGRFGCGSARRGKLTVSIRYKLFIEALQISEKANKIKIEDVIIKDNILKKVPLKVTHLECSTTSSITFERGFRRGKDLPTKFIIKCSNTNCIQEFKSFKEEKRTGFTHSSKRETTKLARVNTCIDKYGHKTAMQNEVCKQNQKNTNLEKYGVENVFQMEGMVERLRKISTEKYGVDNYSKTEEAKKSKQEAILSGKNPKFGSYFKDSRHLDHLLINGIQYRSSWEVRFHQEKPILKYEDITIPYFLENDSFERKYIVDFVDYENKILYEIKPMFMFLKHKAHDNNQYKKTMTKIKSAIQWAKEHGYKYKVITEKQFPFLE